MPTAREIVGNRPLAGSELKRIMLDHCRSLLDNLGVLNSMMAFGRCAFDVRIALHTDNVMMPDHTIQSASAPETAADVARDPSLAAVERMPLKEPSEDAVVFGAERSVRIDSPNLERLRHGLPVTVTSRGDDGGIDERQVEYPKDAEDVQDNVVDMPSDEAANKVRADWGMKPIPKPPQPTQQQGPPSPALTPTPVAAVDDDSTPT